MKSFRKFLKESAKITEAWWEKRIPYLLKNAKVGDVFRDAGDLNREYKVTKVTPAKVYATCVKDPNTTGEYNRNSSEYNETNPEWVKLFTLK